MKVAIITEGNSNTGYGHLTRCLSIYQAFEEKGITPVYIANCDETAKKFISNINIIQLNWIKNIDKLIDIINGYEIAIIDSYLAELEIYHKIYKAVKKVVYNDDYLRLDYPPGIIMNGTIDAENLPYKKDINHNYFLGVNFVPLRKEFWDVNVNDIQVVKNSILMVFGGQDIRNLTELILNFLIKEFPDYHIDVVLGNHKKKYINKENIKFHHNTTAVEMLNLMKENEIVITAGGQTLYELARLKKNTIAVGVINNQINNIKGFVKYGFIKDLLWFDDKNLFTIIKDRINKIKYSDSELKVDGQGARRIVNQVLNLHGKNFYLRKFHISDIVLIFNLSNDTEVRNVSIQKTKILYEDHKKWFVNALTNPDAFYLVAVDGCNKLIGQIKFDIKNNNATVSISISADYRGKGYSFEILKESCNEFYRTYPHISCLYAYILKENEISKKIFKKNLFLFIHDEIVDNRIFELYNLKKENSN